MVLSGVYLTPCKSFIICYNAPDELIIKFKYIYTYLCSTNDNWLFLLCIHAVYWDTNI